MAEKPRTPKPPGPVQAPRRRDTPSPPSASGGVGSLPRWVWAALVGVIALVAAIAFALSSGTSKSSASSVKATMIAAGCSYRDVKPFPPRKDKNNYHADFPSLSTPTKGLWSTFPPSGGSHYGLWSIWGFFTSPVNPRQVVHNEEHGGVIIWWGPKVPSTTVDKLQAFYDEKPDGMLGTPIAGLDSKIALTAWTGDVARYYRNGYYGIGHIAICKSFDLNAFRAFRDAYRGKGPEGIPLSSDKAGHGPNG